MTLTATDQNRQSAKETLRRILIESGGDTKHSAVVDAIATLSHLNPTPAPARNSELRDGQWQLINAPNFPGGQQLEDGTVVYSLGRIAFNMLQPQDLRLKIDRVLQPVLPIPGDSRRTHDIWVEFTTVNDSQPLRGIVNNLGVCEPSTDNTLQVCFTGGTLMPMPETDLQAWKATFGDQTSVSHRTLKERVMNLFLKLMFGLVAPQGMDQKTGEVAFTMTRSPKGKLQILYLDETLRITKGERGTVLVCERQEQA